jgi:hypothetical protein
MPRKQQSQQVTTVTLPPPSDGQFLLPSPSGTQLLFIFENGNVTAIQDMNGQSLGGAAEARLNMYNDCLQRQQRQQRQSSVCDSLVATPVRKATKAIKKPDEKQVNAPLKTTCQKRKQSSDSSTDALSEITLSGENVIYCTPLRYDDIAELMRSGSLNTNAGFYNIGQSNCNDITNFRWESVSRTNSAASGVSDLSQELFNFEISPRKKSCNAEVLSRQGSLSSLGSEFDAAYYPK